MGRPGGPGHPGARARPVTSASGAVRNHPTPTRRPGRRVLSFGTPGILFDLFLEIDQKVEK